MNWLHEFFIFDMTDYQTIIGTYNYWLVLLSIALSSAASFFSLHFASIAQHIVIKKYKIIALVSGSLVMGSGIWSMSFVGMRAYDIEHAVTYDIWLILLSFIPSVISSYIALNMLIKDKLLPWQLVMGGAFVGLGIGAMHYMGMSAMKMDVALLYDPHWFTLSILVAIGLAIMAISTRYYIIRIRPNLNKSIVSAFSASIMGSAISGMHYIGMIGARYIPNSTADSAVNGIGNDNDGYLTLSVAIGTLSISILAVAITSQLRYRQLLLEKTTNELRLKTTLDNAVDGIITIDSVGLIQDFNNAAISIFGWQEDDIIGKNISILMSQSDQKEQDGYLFDFQNADKETIIGSDQEVVALHKSGRSFPIRLGISQVKIEGYSPLFVGFVTDISERRKMEDDLREAKINAEISADSKSSFLANMSHEIRTPMNAIIGFSDILLESNMSLEHKKHVTTISKSGRSLLHLLNDILDSAKLDKNKLELDEYPFELITLVDTVISTLWLQAKNKGLELTFTIEDKVAAAYFGAEARIHQVLMNLLGNAIKFTEAGSVSLMVSKQDNGMLRFSIQDTGIGISPDRLDGIFNPFTQADASMSRRFGGTGLGTTISKQLVELMGGSIHATSHINIGSCFYIDLPLKVQEFIPEKKSKVNLALSPKRILIVDDIDQNLTLLMLILKRQGHDVYSAQDGLEAVEEFKVIKPDIILMDVQMPKMDGLEATQTIRRYEDDKGLCQTPIIALTASVLLEDKLEAKNAGMNGFANKPIDVNALTKEMARVLNIDTIQQTSTKSVTQTEAPLKRKQIHFNKGVEVWGDIPVYLTELNRFMSVNNGLSDTLLDHIKRSEFRSAQQLAHAIKGSSSNLALLEITRQAGLIESSTGKKDREVSIINTHELEKDIHDFSIELDTLNETYPTPIAQEADTVMVRMSTEALLAMIDELIELTHAGEVDDSMLDEFVKNIEPTLKHEAIKVQNSILEFDFSTAMTALHEVKKQVVGNI